MRGSMIPTTTSTTRFTATMSRASRTTAHWTTGKSWLRIESTASVATLTVESIRNQDFPVVQCAVVLLALLIVAVNLVVDLIVGLIDPRIHAA